MKLDEIITLERHFAELKVLYDNYFSGLERREPLRQREALVGALRRLETSGMPGSTQVQFRFNNLRARLSTFEQQWNRIARKIEEGSYKRDKLRAEQILKPTAGKAGVDAGQSAPAAAPPLGQASASGSASPNGLPSSDKLRALHAQYAAGRAASNETVVSYESMVSSLQKQVPLIIEKYKCKSVEFRVVQKDGKTSLKAFPVT